jgi:hypothetical protein
MICSFLFCFPYSFSIFFTEVGFTGGAAAGAAEDEDCRVGCRGLLRMD